MRGSVGALPRPAIYAIKKPKGLGGEYQFAGTDRRWRFAFRRRGRYHGSAAAQLLSLGHELYDRFGIIKSFESGAVYVSADRIFEHAFLAATGDLLLW
jgi:hypothetical protein